MAGAETTWTGFSNRILRDSKWITLHPLTSLHNPG
jgi:hypothetical protein